VDFGGGWRAAVRAWLRKCQRWARGSKVEVKVALKRMTTVVARE
jgi:hypothetical protein